MNEEEDCEFIDDDALYEERGNNLKDVRLGDCDDLKINPSLMVCLDKRLHHLLPDKEDEEVKKQN